MYYIFFLFRQLSLSLSPPISYFGNTIAKNQTIFFFFFLLFWQCHCHKLIATIFFFPPISPMELPQIHCHNSFSLLFRQCHCHKPIVTIFFSLLFRQYHCHKSIATFFFFYWRNDMCTPSPTWGVDFLFIWQVISFSFFLMASD